jgi:hypothetical protein
VSTFGIFTREWFARYTWHRARPPLRMTRVDNDPLSKIHIQHTGYSSADHALGSSGPIKDQLM